MNNTAELSSVPPIGWISDTIWSWAELVSGEEESCLVRWYDVDVSNGSRIHTKGHRDAI